jgi:hypothetical protein
MDKLHKYAINIILSDINEDIQLLRKPIAKIKEERKNVNVIELHHIESSKARRKELKFAFKPEYIQIISDYLRKLKDIVWYVYQVIYNYYSCIRNTPYQLMNYINK